jgi:SAM-dependent methyltransferase
MSVGLLAARRPQNYIRMVLPLAMLSMALAIGVFLAYTTWEHKLTITVGDQQTSPRLIYFGAEYRPADPSRWIIPMWAVAGGAFALIALTFVGLGQVMGRAFDAIPNRVIAYTVDVLGSLTGIAAFAAMSYFELPPTAWYLPIVLLTLYFADWRAPMQASAAAATLLVAAIGAHALPSLRAEIFWSPYYKVTYRPEPRTIESNNLNHQTMLPIGELGPVYLLPHLLNRDAGGQPFEEALIIGAGSGNDVAAALRAGAKRVDAVEIDPVIAELGRRNHPDRPYADPRVTIHLDDGRSFMRRTDRSYDLAVYAVVDSLVLHSGFSSLRLENFLFTREAFEDVKRKLKPGGVFAMYNFYRQGWVVSRLAGMAQDVFGAPPIVISLPFREEIRAAESQIGHFTVLLAGNDSARLQGIRESFERHRSFWVNPVVAQTEESNGFRAVPPPGEWHKAAPARIEALAGALLPSDDWPHLYLRAREIPWAPIGQGMVVIAVLSLVILFAFAPPARVRPNATMFFLGAGFMLLETKAVVHMALLFGATWVVNSVVFFAILVMILLSNLYVLQLKPRRLAPYYGLLIAALLVNALVPMNVFLSLDPLARTLASCAVVFVPVFFAGVIFAALFAASRQPDVDFGSNVAGIILGGLSEQLSLVMGFNYLILVAIAYYLLSLVFRPRGVPA